MGNYKKIDVEALQASINGIADKIDEKSLTPELSTGVVASSVAISLRQVAQAIVDNAKGE